MIYEVFIIIGDMINIWRRECKIRIIERVRFEAHFSYSSMLHAVEQVVHLMKDAQGVCLSIRYRYNLSLCKQ